MVQPTEVELQSLDATRFRDIYLENFAELAKGIEWAREVLRGVAIWHLSSTALGGGVAEMLHTHLGYIRGAGFDCRWIVIGGTHEFFEITKRIHNNIHGSPGDGGPLGDAEREVYEAVLAENVRHLKPVVKPGDVVFCHDPQTAGAIPALHEFGARMVWRSHVGADRTDSHVERAMAFLRPYVEAADAYVFSRRQFIWPGLDQDRTWLMPPTIDAFSPKNQDLDEPTVKAILAVAGLSDSDGGGQPVFTRLDGTPKRVDREARRIEAAILPDAVQLVAQISRWDGLKDPIGLLQCFAEHLDIEGVHLVLAGPDVEAVEDDPEGAAVLGEAQAARQRLKNSVRSRVHLVSLPMEDRDENGAIVNALQRRADVIVQKSIAEGFGLTVAEGMWKGRPVVASRCGGIQDQIVDGESGILLDDPHDLAKAGAEIARLLNDRELAERLGAAARQRIGEHFLALRRLLEYFRALEGLFNLTPS